MYERHGSADIPDESSHQDHLRMTLERLLALDATDVDAALDQAVRLAAAALRADAIDVFTYDADEDALVARGSVDASGTSAGENATTRLSAAVPASERLPLARGGRLVDVYRTHRPWLDGHAERGSPGAVRDARSQLLCPIVANGACQGVLLVASARPAHFSESDLSFAEAVARWMGLVLHNAALTWALTEHGEDRERRAMLKQRVGHLTRRQQEVAALIAGGHSNDEIARRLVLTPGTVANHVEHILRRLQFDSRVEVATLMAELGLHRPELEREHSA